MNKPLIEARIKEIDAELASIREARRRAGRLTLEDQECLTDRFQLHLETNSSIEELMGEKDELSRELAKPLAEVSVSGAENGLHYGRNRDGEEGLFEDYEESIGEI